MRGLEDLDRRFQEYRDNHIEWITLCNRRSEAMALADPTALSVTTQDRLRMVRLALQIHSTWKDPEKMASILEKEIGEILDQLKTGEELHSETQRS